MTSSQKQHPFTLLELLLGISLLLLATTFLGWKMDKVLAKKKFTTEKEKLQSRFVEAHNLALTLQADWEVHLVQEKERIIVQTYSPEQKKKVLPTLYLHHTHFFWNDKPATKLTLRYSATGHLFPSGTLAIHYQKGSLQEKGELRISPQATEKRTALPTMHRGGL